jgi:hypothetical protein
VSALISEHFGAALVGALVLGFMGGNALGSVLLWMARKWFR